MHHGRDWNKYNKELVNRGKLDFWINLNSAWYAPEQKKNGRPFTYADGAILTMLYIRFKFHLSLRELQGFLISIMAICNRTENVPCYTQVCRRMKTLSIPKQLLEKKGVTDIVLDTTGLKVYGAGEWRAKKYGGQRRWMKVHLSMDLKTKKLVVAEATDEYKHDTTYLEMALEAANRKRGKVLLDGVGDSRSCYELAKKRNKMLITPPKQGAIIRHELCYRERNDAIRVIRGLGGDRIARSIWSKLTGYNKRVEIESMIARWKRLYGCSLKSRTEERIEREIKLKARMINRMVDIGLAR
jgi:hypothetical protein